MSDPTATGVIPGRLAPFLAQWDYMVEVLTERLAGLTDEEFRQVDAVIRKTTLEKFGPVRSVKPSLVFELGFEGINRSPRHKSGIAVRFPRMLRIRRDKPLHEANTLQDLEVLLKL